MVGKNEEKEGEEDDDVDGTWNQTKGKEKKCHQHHLQDCD